MWVIKAKGESFYVDHVVCELPWSTKETPKNSHTKGSIKIKKCLLTIDNENTAHLTKLTPEDEQRLANPKTVIRVITKYGAKLRDAVQSIEHGPVKCFGGGCSTAWFVAELYSEEDLLLLKLMDVPNLRKLMPNEVYFEAYDEEHSDNWDELYEA